MFYTDVEHHVETVTEGVFIVLQYDIEVATGTDKETAEESFDDCDWPLEFVSNTYSNYKMSRSHASCGRQDSH